MKRLHLILAAAVVGWVGWLGTASGADAPEEPVRWGLDETAVSRLEALHAQAEDLIVSQRFRDALEVYQEILFLEPDDEVAYVNSGRIHLILGNFDQAGRAYENALDINPANEEALAGLERIADPDGRRADPSLPEDSFPPY